MDYFGNARTAIAMVWKHKILWLVGLLASCGGGGIGSSLNLNLPTGRGGTTGTPNAGIFTRFVENFVRTLQENYSAAILVAIALGCFLLVVGLVFWLIGVLGRGALIVAVQQIRREGRTTFNQAWSGAWNRARSLIGMNMILGAPVFVISLIFGVGSIALFFSTILPLLNSSTAKGPSPAGVGLTVAVVATLGVLICGLALYGFAANLLRIFAERAIMMEQYGAVASLRRGWAVFLGHLGDGLVTGIINWLAGLLIGIAVGIVLFAVGILLSIGTVGFGALANGRIFQEFSVGLILPLVGFFTLISLLTSLVGAVLVAFGSTNWTLAYEQMAVGTLTSPTAGSAVAVQ